jgi:hypothetical protein
MLYRFMVKHRETGKLVEPISSEAMSLDLAIAQCWTEIAEGLEKTIVAAQVVYALVQVEKVPKRWMGELPKTCDLCKGSLEHGWVDGRTSLGPWGNMCVKRADGNRSCFQMYGPKQLGSGMGQRYDGNGWKVEG